MRDIITYLKEEASPSVPSGMPNMGGFNNGDIANDVGDTFKSDFKTGSDLKDDGKKKKNDYIITLNDVGGKVQFGESQITFKIDEKTKEKKFFDMDGNSILTMAYDINHPLYDVLGE